MHDRFSKGVLKTEKKNTYGRELGSVIYLLSSETNGFWKCLNDKVARSTKSGKNLECRKYCSRDTDLNRARWLPVGSLITFKGSQVIKWKKWREKKLWHKYKSWEMLRSRKKCVHLVMYDQLTSGTRNKGEALRAHSRTGRGVQSHLRQPQHCSAL